MRFLEEVKSAGFSLLSVTLLRYANQSPLIEREIKTNDHSHAAIFYFSIIYEREPATSASSHSFSFPSPQLASACLAFLAAHYYIPRCPWSFSFRSSFFMSLFYLFLPYMSSCQLAWALAFMAQAVAHAPLALAGATLALLVLACTCYWGLLQLIFLQCCYLLQSLYLVFGFGFSACREPDRFGGVGCDPVSNSSLSSVSCHQVRYPNFSNILHRIVECMHTTRNPINMLISAN